MALRQLVEGYLMTVSPMRFHQTTAQIKAAAKQMERSNRIPVAVAVALMEGAANAGVNPVSEERYDSSEQQHDENVGSDRSRRRPQKAA